MSLFSINKKTKKSQFEACIRPHLPDMYRLAYRLTGNQHDAEDLVQDLVLKVHRANKDLEELDQVRSWLAKVLYRLFVDHYRSRKRNVIQDYLTDDENEMPEAEDQTADLESLLTHRQLLNDIAIAMDCLSDDHRVLIIMFEIEGYSLAEIQEVLDLPLGTLKSRLFRARSRLREILKERGTFSEVEACLVQEAQS